MNLLWNIFKSIGVLSNHKPPYIQRLRLLHPIGLIFFILMAIYVFIRVGTNGFVEEINDTYILW